MVRTLEGHLERVTAVAVTQDGVARYRFRPDAAVWDLKPADRYVFERPYRKRTAVAVTPDGSRAVSA
jgi:hypothetical protein